MHEPSKRSVLFLLLPLAALALLLPRPADAGDFQGSLLSADARTPPGLETADFASPAETIQHNEALMNGRILEKERAYQAPVGQTGWISVGPGPRRQYDFLYENEMR